MEIEGLKYEKPVLIEGFPGVGLAGTIAVNHIVSTLKLKEIAYIESEAIPPLIGLRDGRIVHPVRIHANSGLIVVVSDIPIELKYANALAKSLVDWVASKNVILMISLAGIARMRREREEGERIVVGAASSQGALKILDDFKIKRIEFGTIVGMPTAMLLEGEKRDIPTLLIMAEAHSNYPDAAAASKLVEVLNRALNLGVDIKPLLEEAKEIEAKVAQLMEKTRRSVQRPALPLV